MKLIKMIVSGIIDIIGIIIILGFWWIICMSACISIIE